MRTTIEKTVWGQLPDGRVADLYTLRNAVGATVKLTNYGTIITEAHVPDRNGRFDDVVLGFDNLEQYVKGHPYFGCTVGRFANRIAKGRFALNGRVYQLAVNNGPNHLHGGLIGFDKVLWKAEPQENGVKFMHRSVDGDEGYPGNLDVTVVITLTERTELNIQYKATADQPTPVNLTNHSYFNLAGSGDVLQHEIMIAASHFTEVDEHSIPTGRILKVEGSPFDFTRSLPIGGRFTKLANEPRGYDHNYVLDSRDGSLALAALAYEPKSGRTLETYTTEPGVQFYTGNFLDGSLVGKRGVTYKRYAGFCLEAQHYPDAINYPEFPSVVLDPGETYTQTTVYRFGAK